MPQPSTAFSGFVVRPTQRPRIDVDIQDGACLMSAMNPPKILLRNHRKEGCEPPGVRGDQLSEVCAAVRWPGEREKSSSGEIAHNLRHPAPGGWTAELAPSQQRRGFPGERRGRDGWSRSEGVDRGVSSRCRWPRSAVRTRRLARWGRQATAVRRSKRNSVLHIGFNINCVLSRYIVQAKLKCRSAGYLKCRHGRALCAGGGCLWGRRAVALADRGGARPRVRRTTVLPSASRLQG